MREEMINKSNLQQTLVAFEMSRHYCHYSETKHKPHKHF